MNECGLTERECQRRVRPLATRPLASLCFFLREQQMKKKQQSMKKKKEDLPLSSSANQQWCYRESPLFRFLLVILRGALGTRVDGAGADVMVALYESGLVTECAQGENRGRVLTNDFVVRRLEKLSHVKNMSPKKKVSGSVRFALWEGFDAANCGFLVFVQNGSLHTFGIQQLQIPDAI